MSQKTFIKITNRDIYDKLVSIEKCISKIKGTITWHTWAIGFIVLIILALFKAVI